MKISKKQIDKVMLGFNFEAAAKIYELLNWKWYTLGRIPNEDDIREKAISLLGDLRENAKIKYVTSGGLKASQSIEDRVLTVKLQLVALSSIHDNLDLE